MAQPTLPSNQPQWADTGIVTEPTTPYKSLGWTAIKPPFAYFNWWMNKVYQWTQYLNAKVNFLPGTLADEVLTITANLVTATQANSTFGAVTANLYGNTFTNFTTGGLWLCRGNGTNPITVFHQQTAAPAYFRLAGNQNVVLNDAKDYLLFQLNADGYWYEITRSASLPHAGIQSYTAGAITLANGDETILVNSTAGASSMTLPTAANNKGKMFRIKKTDSSANAITISTTSAQTIDGLTSVVLSAQYATLEVISDGSNWSSVQSGYAPSQTVIDGGTSASSATVYTATPNPGFAAYSAGMSVQFKSVLANTGACTLNVSGLGAKNLKVFINGVVTDPPANTIAAAAPIIATYDGTQFLIQAGIPHTGQRLIAILNPSAVSSLALTGLVAGTRYRVCYNLVQNTSAGNLSGRFNNDSGANYNGVSVVGGTGGGAAVRTSTGTTLFSLTDATGTAAAATQITGSFEFQAMPGTLTKAGVSGQSMCLTGATTWFTTSFGYQYAGGANVTEMDIVTTAGTFTGQVLVYALGA